MMVIATVMLADSPIVVRAKVRHRILQIKPVWMCADIAPRIAVKRITTKQSKE